MWQIVGGGLQLADTAGLLGLPLGVVGLVVSVLALRGPAEDDDAEVVRRWANVLARAIAESESWMLRRQLEAGPALINLTYSLHPTSSREASALPAGRLASDPSAGFPGILDFYQSLRPRRLVITGAPGAGKSLLAGHLMLSLISNRDADAPVPVRIPVAYWDPAKPLDVLLADYLTNVYDWPKRMTARLVRQGMVLPVLDGLDELPSNQRDAVVPLLGRWLAGFPAHIVTCRRDAYDELSDVAVRALGTAVVVEPLSASAIADYLLGADPGRGWRAVAEAVAGDPSGPLAQALSSPVALMLALTSYSGPGHRELFELTDQGAFPDTAAVMARIFDTADPTTRFEGWNRAGRQHLTLLTDAMGRENDGALLWWRMAGTYESRGMLWAVRIGLLLLPLPLITSVNPSLAVLALFACAATVIVALGLPRRPVPLCLKLPDFGRAGWGGRIRGVAAAATGGAVIGALVHFVLSALLGEDPGTAVSTPGRVVVLVCCVLIGCVMPCVRANANAEPGRSGGDLGRDFRCALTVSSAAALLLYLPWAGFAWGAQAPHGDLRAWSVWVIPPICLGTAFLLTASAWGRYRLVHFRLALEGELPWRLRRFLQETQERGLLMPADGYGGGCYAFRHRMVLEVFAARAVQRPHLGAVQRFQVEIRTEVLNLPESVAYRAYRADGNPEAATQAEVHIETLTQRVLDEELTAVASPGREAYQRFQQAQERMRAAVRRPWWAQPTAARMYAVAALVAGGVVWGAELLLMGARQNLVGAESAAVAVLAVALALAVRQRRVTRPRLHGTQLPLPYRAGAMVGLYSSLPPLLASVVSDGLLRKVLLPALAVAVVSLFAWIVARPHAAHARALHDDDPRGWPVLPRSRARHREAALQARRDWLNVVARDGVMPLIWSELQISEDTTTTPAFPAIDLSRLTGTRHSDSFVETAASQQVAFDLGELDSASIGVSGPRGAGKSHLMERFCTHGPTSTSEDLLVLVAAPTSYDPREFLIHLFTEVCRGITGDSATEGGRPGPDPARRRAMAFRTGAGLTLVAGVAMVAVTLLWSQLNAAVAAATAHLRALLVAGGVTLICAGLIWAFVLSVRTRRQALGSFADAEAVAAHHLRTLRYQLSVMRSRNAQLSLPAGLQLSDSAQVQHTEQVLTYPELVARFRALLDMIALERRHAGGRVVIGIDELDKLGDAQAAERFLNDLKVVFGIRGCHFLVAVSEDALTAFGRHVVDIRTAFDTAFDQLVAVRPLDLAQARKLLELRGVWLPDPYLWVCQILSGGLPRDLLRTVMSLATDRSLHNTTDMRTLVLRLIEDDICTVLSAQSRQASALTSPQAPAVAHWIASASEAPACADAWEEVLGNAPLVTAGEYEVTKTLTQLRAYLGLGAALLRTFTADPSDGLPRCLEALRAMGPAPVDRLTAARAKLAAEPEAVWVAVNRYRQEVLGLAPLPEPQ
ncbi:NACHT domain-containing protein [Streptomyces canus]|uniref:NACHT domain-containing protein n=1 Tax=Streptomyces canus TaxID=58343 RepID=UPI00224DE965|nr:NACHT domain-containing protein [Streptomyces canus]MCX5261770.1 NACHT domain-containing protein [Streptomyces canus]